MAPRSTALAAVLGTAVLSCSPGVETRMELPQMRLVSAAAVVCAPDRRWDVDDSGERWRFRGVSSVQCAVSPGAEGPLVFRLEPAPESASFVYTLTWGQTPLFDGGEVRLAEVGEIAVPEGSLTPGRHELRLRRLYRPSQIQVPSWRDNLFTSVGYSTAAGRVSFEPGRRNAYTYLADFLELGLTGLGREKWGGLLFDGPGTATLEASGRGERILGLAVENNSDAPARVSLKAEGGEAVAEVPAGERSRLQLTLASGASAVELAVDGRVDGLLLAGYPTLSVEESDPPSSPPIVLVTLDTTRRDALSPYGADPALTPNLAAFAETATVFERAYSTSPWTQPSHASMMTGLWPTHHEASIVRPALAPWAPTLAELLEPAGYASAGLAGGEVCSSRFGIGRGFHLYRDPEHFETPGDQLTDDALRALEDLGTSRLFLFVNYFDPHAVYQAPEEFQQRVDLDRYRRQLEGAPLWQRFDRGDIAAWTAIVDGEGQVTPETMAYARAAYLAEVAFMDSQLGRLFAELKRRGWWDRALIVVVADHGEMLGEEDYFGHAGRLSPELTEIPLMIKWPGQSRGRRVLDLVSQVDLFPTVLAAAGIEAPSNDGLELTPDGLAPPSPRRSYVLMEEHETLFHPLRPTMRVAPDLYGVQRPSSRRLLWDGGDRCFQRGASGWEPTPCAADGAAAYEGLRRLLQSRDPLRGDAGESLSPEDRKAFEALGYL